MYKIMLADDEGIVIDSLKFIIEKEFQGGSGAGCSASVLNSYILTKMNAGLYKRVLFAATGALLSTVSSGQGESIPCISHAVQLEV